ncbi:MAG: hypothetical protein KDI36_16070 [Pseudomonadales bacterium]|nr:hypothetical protein [Pseudomonadales bacterium]
MSELISTDSVFSAESRQTLCCLMDMMIPVSEHMPSAADPAIAALVLNALAARQELVLEAVAVLSEGAGDARFHELSQLQREALVADLRAKTPQFISFFQSQVATQYYQDDRVMVALGLEPRPPHPGGYKAPETDWTLLEPVRARPPLYRPV